VSSPADASFTELLVKYPFARAAEAYARMMSEKVEFRAVLTAVTESTGSRRLMIDYGLICVAKTLVAFWVNSNRSNHSLGTLRPSTCGGVKVHRRATCTA
jgi:hypothetical protein